MSLAATFLAGLGEAAASAAPPGLDAALARLVDQAHGAWPAVAVPDDAFVAYVAQRVPGDADPLDHVGAVHAGDLYLACGCTRGDPAAVAAFEQHFMSQVTAYLSRNDSLPAFSDELKQVLRARLLVGEDGLLPRIAGYNGRGPLGAWLRVSAVRTAIDLRRASNPADPNAFQVLEPARGAAPDPEMALVRTRHAAEFRAAFEETLRGLTAREANILRLHFIDGMSAHAVGALYRTTGRTVQRWIAQARQNILERTYGLLRERLALSTTELDALLALVESQLDVSIARHLRDRAPGESE